MPTKKSAAVASTTIRPRRKVRRTRGCCRGAGELDRQVVAAEPPDGQDGQLERAQQEVQAAVHDVDRQVGQRDAAEHQQGPRGAIPRPAPPHEEADREVEQAHEVGDELHPVVAHDHQQIRALLGERHLQLLSVPVLQDEGVDPRQPQRGVDVPEQHRVALQLISRSAVELEQEERSSPGGDPLHLRRRGPGGGVGQNLRAGAGLEEEEAPARLAEVGDG